MARKPRSTKALIDFVKALYSSLTLPEGLLYLVGILTSSAAGCQYCASHNVSKAEDEGIDAAKIAAVWEFETSPLFTDAERAALNFAFKGGQAPSGVETADWERLKAHYNEIEITEILFVICQFGVFNRFNDAVAATIEPTPLALCKSYLSEDNWQAGKFDA